MSEAQAADRYARALFELGKETGELTVMTLQLRKFTGVYQDSLELQSTLQNPVVEDAQREAITSEIAGQVGVGKTVLNVLRLLARRQRVQLLPAISARLSQLVDQDAKVVRATVSSAVPLDDGYRQRLRAELEQATGRKVVIEFREDPSLIAGIVTTIGDHVIDGSIRGRLRAIQQRLVAS